MSQLTIVITTFVLIGWLISLCFHEFSHALIAYWGGDTTIKNKGYLTLNPLKYTDPLMSIILPLVFLFLGGLPLPGAAVYIEEKRLRNRWWRSAVALAGPVGSAIASLIFACLWHWLLAVTPQDKLLSTEEFWGYWFLLLCSLAFLVFINFYVMLLNLLPIPPLDGYRILEPWLPEQVQRQFRNFGLLGLIILFVLLFNFPPLSRTLFDWSFQIGTVLGVDPIAANTGRIHFEFSSNRLILSILLLGLALPLLWRGFKRPKHFLANTLEIIGFFLQIFGQFKPALACYNKAIEINPTIKEQSLWMNRGAILFNLKQYEEAIYSDDKAIEIEPTYLDTALPFPIDIHQIWTNRGQALGMLKRYDEAIASYDQALKLSQNLYQQFPNDPLPLNIRGAALSRMGRAAEAIASYEQAIQLQPDYATSWYNKACHYAENGQVVEAISSLQRAFELNSDFADSLVTDRSFDSIRDREEFQQLLKN